MGEIADMMIGGELCEGCGEFIDAGHMGIPMYCSVECARASGVPEEGIKSRIA